jgi:hypothetical protein
MARTRTTDSWTKERGVEGGNVHLALYKWERMTTDASVSCPECGEAVGVRSDRVLLNFRPSDSPQAPKALWNQGNAFKCINAASKLGHKFS